MHASLSFKLADRPEEFEAIHRLNYRTFVEEIPQHAVNDAGRLVDRFHEQNTYAVCLHAGELVGMIAGRSQRPFSLDQKLGDLDRHLPPHEKVVEVRLLAVDPRYRKQQVFARLAGVLARHFRAQGCDLAVISGTTRELPLYGHLGFKPFGPLIGSEAARYQPMVLSLGQYAAQAVHLETLGGAAPQQLLPGPVALRPEVVAALAQPAISHRSEPFMALSTGLRSRLSALCGAVDALLMPGTGTLANEAVAAQLAARGGHGLILSNGEFGERLLDHARRWRLDFEPLRQDWGKAFEPTALADAFERHRPAWVWAVLCETSTGMRNPLEALKVLCQRHGSELCLDAVSAVGLQALDLRGVHLASTVSGKALGSYAGLAIVLHDGRLVPAGQLPRYLDLAANAEAGGVPHTQSSNLFAALAAAVDIAWPQRWAAIAAADRQLREGLERHGFVPLVPAAQAMPGVLTLALPPGLDAGRLARRLARAGFQLAHGSDYLRQRNWLQICLMGQWDAQRLALLPDTLQAQAQRIRNRIPDA